MRAMSTRRSSAHFGLSVEKIEALLKSPRKISEEGCMCRNSNLGRRCPLEGPYGRLHFVSVRVGRVAEGIHPTTIHSKDQVPLGT